MNHAAGCWHCGEPLPPEPPQALVGGVARPVCCAGCHAAAEWIEQLGLGDYYRLRAGPAERALDAEESRRSAAAWARPELARHAVRELDASQREAVLLVDGIRCAACVWLIERAVGGLPGVSSVQVNASARRARLVWDSTRCDLPRLLDAFGRAGYRALPLDAAALDDSRRREARGALKRLLVAGFGAMQAMMYASALYLGAFEGIDAASRDLFRWFGLLVATPVVFYAARPFFAGALRSLRARRLGMDVPVALAVALIYAASLVEALRGGGEVYFDSVSMFVFFLLLGRYLEMRARHRSGDLADALARLSPAVAERIRADGSLERVGAVELIQGDRVHVSEGALIPADGRLASARCRVDEALLSGESTPIRRARGEPLLAGSLVVEGPLELEVERVGAATTLAGIVALVTRAQTERPRLAELGERAAAGFVARVLSLAALTAVAWSLIDPARAFTATLAVLVVSCPCAFALAVPAALTRALAALAQRGVLAVRADAIEQLALASHAVFDKTGTLTSPSLSLADVELVGTDGSDAAARVQALQLAAALARGSRHPVAQAIASAAGDAALPAVADLQVTVGGGIEGCIDGRRLRLGHPGFALGTAVEAADMGTVLADAEGGIARFHLSAQLHPEAADCVDALRADGLEIEVLSGDAPAAVAATCTRLGVRNWRARQRPEDKLARLSELRLAGARVLAVGDGSNDAPVLAGADVSVALGSGAELAQAASDIVLSGGHLGRLPGARQLARQTLRVLRQNQRWALLYNVLAVPVAALGWVPPWAAALGMSLSSLAVVLNALRIGRRPPEPTARCGTLRPAVPA